MLSPKFIACSYGPPSNSSHNEYVNFVTGVLYREQMVKFEIQCLLNKNVERNKITARKLCAHGTME